MHRLLLTGGSGYIGGEILAQIRDPANSDLRGTLEVYAVYRSEGHKQKLIDLGCHPVKLNIGDFQAVKDFVRNKKINMVIELTEPFDNKLALGLVEALSSAPDKATLITTGGAKMFASFAGYDTTNILYDDADPLEKSGSEKEWAISQVAQENERQLLAAGKQSGVSVHIVIPPIVYGQSRTFGNPISIQIVGVCKIMLEYGQPIVIPGTDDLPQTYAICHVEDIASMYLAIIRRATNGESTNSGVYFAENGVVEWDKLAVEFAKGFNLPDEVKEATPEMMKNLVDILGVQDETWVRPWVGGRTNIRGRAGRKIGWTPKYDVKHMYAVASEEAKHMARHI